ncbi:hypothetical protein MPLB_2420009 [Mesorhizobium sp. ORS 3324]|nr:hypothetical protein MPLB_2420009 [Mesorhizobium sp. ORS 3324]
MENPIPTLTLSQAHRRMTRNGLSIVPLPEANRGRDCSAPECGTANKARQPVRLHLSEIVRSGPHQTYFYETKSWVLINALSSCVRRTERQRNLIGPPNIVGSPHSPGTARATHWC